MAKVHIVQCLCPQRHCILGLSYEEGKGKITPENSIPKLKAIIDGLIGTGRLDHKCALCQREVEFTYEDAVTKFRSMKDAMPTLRALQLGNMIARVEFEEQQRLESN